MGIKLKTGKAKNRKTAKTREGKSPLGRTLGMRSGETWVHVFKENRKKHRTDEKLAEFMAREFPMKAKAGIGDFNGAAGVKQVRSYFNRDANNHHLGFKSIAYDTDGSVAEVRRGRAPGGKTAKHKGGRKSSAKSGKRKLKQVGSNGKRVPARD